MPARISDIDDGSIDWGQAAEEPPAYVLGAPGADMHAVRIGQGAPLLMIHGLGGSHRSWATIAGGLSDEREVIAVDLPGFGDSPALRSDTTIANLADAVTGFLQIQGLTGVDMVGSSMGARLVLELARRGVAGAVVALDPGGFWSDAEKPIFEGSIAASIRLVRLLQPVMPAITGTPVGRTMLLPQFSPRPWRLSSAATLTEMRDYARATRFDELLRSLVQGPDQQGMAEPSARPLVIGWGRQDKVCFPGQAKRAMALFPHARLHWFDRCGHFPHWDQPAETVRVILEATARG